MYTVGQRTESVVHPQRNNGHHRHPAITGHWRIHTGETVWMSQVWKQPHSNLFFLDKKEVEGQTCQKIKSHNESIRILQSFVPKRMQVGVCCCHKNKLCDISVESAFYSGSLRADFPSSSHFVQNSLFFFLRNTCNLCSLNVCGLGWVFLTNSEWISSDLREELPRCLLCIVSYRKALLRVCYVTVTTQSRRERLVWFLTCWEKTLFLSASRFYVCLKNICCWITMARRQLCTHKICPRELW